MYSHLGLSFSVTLFACGPLMSYFYMLWFICDCKVDSNERLLLQPSLEHRFQPLPNILTGISWPCPFLLLSEGGRVTTSSLYQFLGCLSLCLEEQASGTIKCEPGVWRTDTLLNLLASWLHYLVCSYISCWYLFCCEVMLLWPGGSLTHVTKHCIHTQMPAWLCAAHCCYSVRTLACQWLYSVSVQ